MQKLGSALQHTLNSLEVCPPESGETGQSKSFNGIQGDATPPGLNSQTTGTAGTQRVEASNQTGPLLGAVTAFVLPTDPALQGELVKACVASRLPRSVALWLDAMELEAERGLPTFPPIQKPERSTEMVQAVRQELSNLESLLRPSRGNRELEKLVFKLFVAFNQFMGDELRTEAQLEVWADQLERYPFFAVKKAYDWAVGGEKKMPSISEFVADVRLAMGKDVLMRKRLMENFVNGRAT